MSDTLTQVLKTIYIFTTPYSSVLFQSELEAEKAAASHSRTALVELQSELLAQKQQCAVLRAERDHAEAGRLVEVELRAKAQVSDKYGVILLLLHIL